MYAEDAIPIWHEFATIEEADAYFASTPYPARRSPEWWLSVDILYPALCYDPSQLRRLSGACKKPGSFSLDRDDPVPFLKLKDRIVHPIAA